MFMNLKDENGEPYSEKLLKDICVNFILAGRDTSSVALSLFFWLIDRNPEVEERILEEICWMLEKRGETAAVESAAGDVRFEVEEIKKMEYLQAAISEALRLFPSVPVDHKEVSLRYLYLLIKQIHCYFGSQLSKICNGSLIINLIKSLLLQILDI